VCPSGVYIGTVWRQQYKTPWRHGHNKRARLYKKTIKNDYKYRIKRCFYLKDYFSFNCRWLLNNDRQFTKLKSRLNLESSELRISIVLSWAKNTTKHLRSDHHPSNVWLFQFLRQDWRACVLNVLKRQCIKRGRERIWIKLGTYKISTKKMLMNMI